MLSGVKRSRTDEYGTDYDAEQEQKRQKTLSREEQFDLEQKELAELIECIKAGETDHFFKAFKEKPHLANHMLFDHFYNMESSLAYEAAKVGNLVILESLIDNKLDFAKGLNAYAIHEAIRNNHINCVKTLLPHVDFNAINTRGETPILCLAEKADEAMLDLIMDHNSDHRDWIRLMETALGQHKYSMADRLQQKGIASDVFMGPVSVLQFSNTAATTIHAWHEKIKVDNPCAFKITKGDQSFVLFGTPHVLSLRSFSEPIQDILLNQEFIILERDNMDNPLDEMNRFVNAHQQEITRPESQESVLNQFSSEEQNIVKKELECLNTALSLHGKDLSSLSNDILLGSFVGMCYQCIDGQIQTESELIQAYKAQQKKIYGLEKSEDLLSQVKEFSKDAGTLKQSGQLKSFYLKSKIHAPIHADNYSKGLHLQSEPNSEALAVRNQGWIKQLLRRIDDKENKFLVAVGLGHLTNKEHGLLQYFADEGFCVEKYDNEGKLSEYKHVKNGCILM